MRSKTSVFGTPVNTFGPKGGGPSSNNGFNTKQVPAGYSGTVNKKYEGDQSQKIDARSGTPYQSKAGNPDEAKRVRSSSKAGIVLSENGMNLNDPKASGNGVLFAGVSEATGMRANPQPAMIDSPVPAGAQKPIKGDAGAVLANLRSGEGAAWGANEGPENNFQTMGGVMSRDSEFNPKQD